MPRKKEKKRTDEDRREYQRRYYQEHKEKAKAYQKQYNLTHKKKTKSSGRGRPQSEKEETHEQVFGGRPAIKDYNVLDIANSHDDKTVRILEKIISGKRTLHINFPKTFPTPSIKTIPTVPYPDPKLK